MNMPWLKSKSLINQGLPKNATACYPMGSTHLCSCKCNKGDKITKF